MNILVTAGNTQVFIDRVRCLTNIFSGKTGASIARRAYERGHSVTLLTSHPEHTVDLMGCEKWVVERYRSFDDLAKLMERRIRECPLDVVIHCAAVSDYLAGGVFAPAPGTSFDADALTWQGSQMIDRAAGKVKSDEPELWLRLVRAPKLVDRVREAWGYQGVLVKFKLEVGKSLDELLDIAERSRTQSRADVMVANTLEDAGHWAIVGPVGGSLQFGYECVDRSKLADRLIEVVEGVR